MLQIRGRFLEVLQLPRHPFLSEASSNEVVISHFVVFITLWFYRKVSKNALVQLQRFLEIVWWNDPVTTVADFYELTRKTFNSVSDNNNTWKIIPMFPDKITFH